MINEIKNTLEGTNSRITEAEYRISEVEDRMVEINCAYKDASIENKSKKPSFIPCGPAVNGRKR